MNVIDKVFNAKTGEFSNYIFWCPGCKCAHGFNDTWQFNGDFENPTVSPSLLTNGIAGSPPGAPRCHLFIRNGNIEFLSDCEHELAGQTVKMQPL